MAGNNAFLYILLLAFAVFGIYSGYKQDGLSGALSAVLKFGLPALLAVLILRLASRPRPKPPVHQQREEEDQNP